MPEAWTSQDQKNVLLVQVHGTREQLVMAKYWHLSKILTSSAHFQREDDSNARLGFREHRVLRVKN